MENWGIPVALILVHLIMCIAVYVNAMDSINKPNSILRKFAYIIICIFIPILGPIIVNYILGIKPVDVGRSDVLIETAQLSDEIKKEISDFTENSAQYSGCSSGADSSSGGCDGGGGGD